MTKHDLADKRNFISALNKTFHKNDLLALARDLIGKSDSLCGLDERKLPRLDATLRLQLKLLRMGIKKPHLSTNEKLLLIMHKYKKLHKRSPQDFHNDFKKAYPEEFAQIGAQKRKEATRNALLKDRQAAFAQPAHLAPTAPRAQPQTMSAQKIKELASMRQA
jgi:hypothetical protein